jgi:histone H3/H4
MVQSAVSSSETPAAAAAKKTNKSKKIPAAKTTKSTKAGGDGKKKRKKTRTFRSYGMFIRRLLKKIHPDLGLSTSTMDIFEAVAANAYERITQEAELLCARKGKHTMTSQEVKAACRLVLPVDLCQHATHAGDKALYNLGTNSKPKKATGKKQRKEKATGK